MTSPDIGHTLLDAIVALVLVGLIAAPALTTAQTMVRTAARAEAMTAAESVALDAARRVEIQLGCADLDDAGDIAGDAATAIGWPTTQVSVGPPRAVVRGDDGIWRFEAPSESCVTPLVVPIEVRPPGSRHVARHLVVVTELVQPNNGR